MSEPLLKVTNLKKYFKVSGGILHAIDDVSLEIQKGETLGIVGESGCGKSTLGRLSIRTLEPTSGEIYFNGKSITKADKKALKEIRKDMQMIFQDPYACLDPRQSVFELISEPLRTYKIYSKKNDLENRVLELMDIVGLAERFGSAYPHEMDGGRRQRVGIARALALNPKFIVCDEPVSSLDVSIQAQILNLLMDLQEQQQLTYMFITHDLSVVRHISNKIAVMYLGQCVELAESDELFENPMHPYTRALLSSIPVPNLKHRMSMDVIEGEVTSPIDPLPGCRFAPRCSKACDKCKEKDTQLKELSRNHFVACSLYE